MSTAAMTTSIAHKLAGICGEAHVVEDPGDLQKFEIDEMAPRCAVSPGSAEEVAAVLRMASERRWSVVPSGGFTAQHTGEAFADYDLLLRTERLNQIEHYDPGDLTIGAGSGCTVGALNALLAKEHQYLPLDLVKSSASTVGGILARDASGPLRHLYGGLRDFCIGVRFVTGDGKIAKGGGRVVKNVAGYDLMKLLIGSYGTLGVIVAANFKVFPRPNRHDELRTFVFDFQTIAEAISCCDRIVRSPLTPLSLDIVSPAAHEHLQSRSEIRDPDHFAPQHPVGADERWTILLRAAGSETVIARYRRELPIANREISGEQETKLWNCVCNFEVQAAARHQNVMVIAVNTVPSLAEQALVAALQVAHDNNFVLAAIGRVAIASLTLAFLPLSVDPPSAMQYALAVSAFRAALPETASAVVTRVPIEAKRHFSVWGSSPTHYGSMLAVKRALDPQNILNRGRFLF